MGFFANLFGFNPLEIFSDLFFSNVSQNVTGTRQDLLEDRDHTEMREDTVYQRGVEDMRKAGLNPYTIGANPSPSSSSSVGENMINNRIQMLGYILDLKNLNARNREITNNAIANVLKILK